MRVLHHDRLQLLLCSAALTASLAAAAPAAAGTTTLLTENFSGSSTGLGVTGYIGGSAFHVTNANVDVLGPGTFSCVVDPGGKCVDLVGENNAGGIATNNTFNLVAGDTYELTFDADLQGYPDGQDLGSASFLVGLGGYSQSETLIGGAPVHYDLTYTPGADQNGSLSFVTTVAADYVHGAVLSNVVLTDTTPAPGGVPEPETWALMISGFGLAGAALRRRRSLLAA